MAVAGETISISDIKTSMETLQRSPYPKGLTCSKLPEAGGKCFGYAKETSFQQEASCELKEQWQVALARCPCWGG